MNDQERSAALEAVQMYVSFRGGSIHAMHAVLTNHEAAVRKRIADEMESRYGIFAPCMESHVVFDKLVALVAPPEPPKPVLCEGCGHTEAAHVSVMLNGERVLLCSDAKFAPAEESTR